MKKYLSLILVIFATAHVYSQNLELSGQVQAYNVNGGEKVYYTQPGKKFDKKKFVLCDAKKNFNFKMSLATIRKDHIAILVFATDTTQQSDDEDACAQQINVGEIASASEFSKQKSIKLRTDLLLDWNCTASPYYDAKEEGKDKFVGNYHFESNDTIRYVEIENMFFIYHAKLSAMTKDFMTEESGSWSYDSDKKVLTFYLREQMNERFGLVISTRRQFHFNVEETPEGILFKSESGVLKKL